MDPFTQIHRLRKKINTIPHPIIREFLDTKSKRYTQNYTYDFFGDPVDAMVTIHSNTVHAPDSVVSLVLLFADLKVGAVTGDVRTVRKNCRKKSKEQG